VYSISIKPFRLKLFLGGIQLTALNGTIRVFCAGLVWLCATSVSVRAAEGEIWVEITDILQRDLPGKVELIQQGSTDVRSLRVPEGKGIFKCVPGQYKALIYVYDHDVPVMVDVQEVVVEEGIMSNLIHEVVEGRLGRIPLREFDRDGDLALDRVEAASGTDPRDPASFPGAVPVDWTSPVISEKWEWYAGDLHVRSVHGGGGQQTVAELVKRAEAAGLDFLAITDRNTMASVSDPAYKSKKVVLIPAMEWGDKERGIALIYGPRTRPSKSTSLADAQGICYRVQSQGGLFVVAHPCFPAQGEGGASTAPWQWGTGFVNAIEVWCRSWRDVPPVNLDAFVAEYHRRPNDKLIYSISRAATASTLSANGQAAMFWDYELTRGLRASLIAGSLSSSAEVPLGEPVTYVFAKEKSAEGILEGLRLGRTFVTTKKDGPIIRFIADEGKNGLVEVSIGGIIPLRKETQLTIQAIGAPKGAKLELLSNGRVIHSHKISTSKVETLGRTVNPTGYTVFRARIVKTPEKQGFGPHEMLAMTGPIYAQNIVAVQADARFQIAELLSKKEYTLETLVAETKEAEPKVVFHLQQLDNLGLLLARDEGPDRLFRLDGVAYKVLDKSLLTVDDLWAPLRSSQTQRVESSAMRDASGNVWVQPRAGARVAPSFDQNWVPPKEFNTLQPERLGEEN